MKPGDKNFKHSLKIISGSPGSGKSFYAKNLALTLKACFLDIDTCSETLVKVGLVQAGKDPNDRDSQYFKETYRDPIYQTLFAIAKDNLANCDVILAGPFTKEIRNPNWLKELEIEFGVIPEVHYIRCDPKIRKNRIMARGEARDFNKLKDWESNISYYGDETPPVFDHVLVDTTN